MTTVWYGMGGGGRILGGIYGMDRYEVWGRRHRVCLFLAQQGTVVDSVGHVPCDSSREWKNARILL